MQMSGVVEHLQDPGAFYTIVSDIQMIGIGVEHVQREGMALLNPSIAGQNT